MSALSADELATRPLPELETRVRTCKQRVDEILTRALAEGRDLSEREAGLVFDDRAQLAELKIAVELAERSRDRAAQIGNAIASTSNPVETRALAEFVEMIAAGRPGRVQVEQRSISSANAGARGAIALESVGRPQWLYQAASIPFALADSLTVTGPLYAALVAQSATAETTGPKPSMADPSLASATLQAFGVIQVVSDQVVRFGVGAQAVTERLASESVFSVNAAFADALETAADEPIAYATSASHMADLAIAKVWAQTGAKPTALVVNSENYPDLADKAAVGPGDTVGAEVVRFNGIPIVVNDAVTAGIGVALNGRAFSAHGTDVLFASLPDLANNTITLRAETYAALLQHDAGAIVAVELGTVIGS